MTTFRKKNIEPTEEELVASRLARIQHQTTNPNYLKDTPKASPVRKHESMGEIPVQVNLTIDYDYSQLFLGNRSGCSIAHTRISKH